MKQAMYSTDRADPAPKEVAEQKPVTTGITRRVKKRESQPNLPRPNSWHTDARTYSQPDLTMPPSQHRKVEPAQPAYRNPPPVGYNADHKPASLMDHSYYSDRTGYQQYGKSTGSLNNYSENRTETSGGFVRKKREEFESIMSQSVDRINMENVDPYIRRPWNEKRGVMPGVNPQLRSIELEIEPAETYPKVVVAKHIKQSQSKAVLGRVPDSGDQKGQRFGSVQDVSYHAVQMPQRQIASSADSSVSRNANYAQVHSTMSGYPQVSYAQPVYHGSSQNVEVQRNNGIAMDKKVPPAIPKRGDSRTKTHALSEHVKSSSWPASSAASQAENAQVTTVSQSSAILPSDLPPVKLYSNNDRLNTSSAPPISQSNPNENSNSATQDIYTAKPVWYDSASEPVFNYDESKLKESDRSGQLDYRVDCNNPPSPPTRDIDHVPSRLRPASATRSTDERYLTKDHLIQDYRKFLEQTEEQEENLRRSLETGDLAQESLSPQSTLSRTQIFPNATHIPSQDSHPLSQTMPVGDTHAHWYAEVERRRQRLSVSSQEPYQSRQDVGNISQTESEMNKRNSLQGQNNERTWRNPSDKRGEDWQRLVRSANDHQPQQPHPHQPHPQQPHPQQPHPQKPQPQQPNPPRSHSHSRQSSDINTPRMRSPISPMLVEAVGIKQELIQKTFAQKIEKAGIAGQKREESRDSRKSGHFDPASAAQMAKIGQEKDLSQSLLIDDSMPANSILQRLKREGSFKNRLNGEADGSLGNETTARKIVPDTKRDARQLGLSDAVFKKDSASGKGLHYHSGSFTADTRGPHAPIVGADRRLNQTAPVHSRTQSIDTGTSNKSYNAPRRRESFEYRSDSESRGVAETRQYWKQMALQQKSSVDEKGDHKKSKSDSEQHQRVESRKKKFSDPSDNTRNPRKVSDPEARHHIRDALMNYYHTKRSPPGSVGSPGSSRPPSISSSTQSLIRSDMYPSNSSLASYTSGHRHWQDSISSQGSFSHPVHQYHDSGFGSSSDLSLSQVRSPRSPPQTGVVSPDQLRAASTTSFDTKPTNGRPGSATISRSASMTLPQSRHPVEELNRRRSHQARRASEKDSIGQHHQSRQYYQRASSQDAAITGNHGTRQGQRSLDERSRLSPTKQPSHTGLYNIQHAELKPITRVQEEETVEPSYQEQTQSSRLVFTFPPGKISERASDRLSPSQRVSPPSSSTESPPQSKMVESTECKGKGVDVSPPPPPTPVSSPWEVPDAEFPPPPTELVQEPSSHLPQLSHGEQTVRLSPKEGTITHLVEDRITATEAQSMQQTPALEVHVDPVPQARPEDTTPSLSPQSSAGRSSPDNHDTETSPLHVPRLPSVKENIVLTNQNEVRNLNRDSPDASTKLHPDIFTAEPEPIDDDPSLDSQDEDKFAAEEIDQSADPLLKWVLQALTPNRLALSDLFPLPQSRRGRSAVGSSNKMTNMDETRERSSTPTKSDSEAEPTSPSESVSLVLSSSKYLRISPAKAMLLTRAKGLTGTDLGNNNTELRKTKEELIVRISKKVDDIKQMQQEVAEEMTGLEDMGRQVLESVKAQCKASECNKYTMYVDDIDRVTKLLLSLSRRLSKVESVLDSMENSEEEEKNNLEKLKRTLNVRYNDAKMLKESIMQRHDSISRMLLNQISNAQHDDFCHFVQMLPRLRVMSQELDDKIKLGEEQLEALHESLKEMDDVAMVMETKDSNGNTHNFKEDASSAIAGSDELNDSSTSTFC